MDDFQHRLLVALDRLAGRGGPVLDDRLAEFLAQQAALIVVLEEIRDRLPDPAPPGP
jgi:hypothetical protein